MEHISLKNRSQFEFKSLEDSIDAENPVRFIDAFVDKLDLTRLGFIINTLKKEGPHLIQVPFS